MGSYVLRRVLALPVILLLVSMTVFAVVRVSQGDPTLLMIGNEGDVALAERLREELGFNRPIVVQYLDWLGLVLRGDLGRSLRLPSSVNQLVLEKLPATIELALLATLFSVVVAVPLGVLAAVWRGRWPEWTITALSSIGVSMPNFWLGILLIFAFSMGLRWLPSSGYVAPEVDLGANLKLMLLPLVTLSFSNAAIFIRVVHASMAEAIWQDYVRTAHAKGLSAGAVVLGHALRNALLPLVTAVGIHFGRLLGGAVVVETIFGIPGLGRLMVESITGRDFTVVQGIVLYLTVITVVTSLIVDIAYAYLDPRIRYA